jgi:hypothetical protein
MNLGSVETLSADLRAAFRQGLLAGPYPSVTFATPATLAQGVLDVSGEPGLDFVALGLRAGDYPTLTGFSPKTDGAHLLVRVEAKRLTFAEKFGSAGSAAGAKVSIELPKPAWEAESFTPVKGVPFMQEVVQAAGSQMAALGRGGTQRHRVLATATLFYPSGQGTLGLESMAGRLLKRFKPGTGLVYGSSQGIVTQAEARPLLQEPEWISCPVVATVTAWTVN